MTPEEPFAAEVLESLPVRKWSDNVYRVMLGDYPPDSANRTGARWNPPDIEAIYTSEIAETAIAEVRYNIRQQTRPIKESLHLTLYEIFVELEAVVDLYDSLSVLHSNGITHEDLFNSDMRISQAVGKTITWLDRDGLRVPSARGASANIVIYPNWTKTETFRFEIKSKHLIETTI